VANAHHVVSARAALQNQVDAAQTSDSKTQDAMKELGKAISSAASTAPALLRSAKKALDDKQLELDDTKAAHAALSVEAATYKVREQASDQLSMHHADVSHRATVSAGLFRPFR
jgi:hypothetical protein